MVAGFCYAAFIFSFLGGVWWGLALVNGAVRPWHWCAAVVPSLIALALFLPWTFGWDWPRPALLILGVLILASRLIDIVMARSGPVPEGWIHLRVRFSIGLSLPTILLSRL